MKKIFISFFIFLFTFWNTLAIYKPSLEEKNFFEKIKPAIEKIDNWKIDLYLWKIDLILPKLDNESKKYWVLLELKNILINAKTPKIENKFYKVLRVIDGDTISFEKDWENIKARLIWIDAPESNKTRYWKNEKWWLEAKLKLEELVLNKNISIEYDENQEKTDKYWRKLIYLFLDWENIWEKLIKEWYAKEYTYNKKYKYQQNFKEAEKIAKENKKGIWENTYEKNEEKVEKTKKIEINELNNETWKIKWNINSKWEKIYHYPSCKSYNKTKINFSQWEKYFDSVEDAKKEGFVLAWNC